MGRLLLLAVVLGSLSSCASVVGGRSQNCEESEAAFDACIASGGDCLDEHAASQSACQADDLYYADACSDACFEYEGSFIDHTACTVLCKTAADAEECFERVVASPDDIDADDLRCIHKRYKRLVWGSRLLGHSNAARHLSNFLAPEDVSIRRIGSSSEPLPAECAAFASWVAQGDRDNLGRDIPEEMRPDRVCKSPLMTVPSSDLKDSSGIPRRLRHWAGQHEDELLDHYVASVGSMPAVGDMPPPPVDFEIREVVKAQGQDLRTALGSYTIAGTVRVEFEPVVQLQVRPVLPLRLSGDFEIYDVYDWHPDTQKRIKDISFPDVWPALLTACGMGCEFEVGGRVATQAEARIDL